MMNEQDARQAIINSAKSILDKVDNIEKITIRQIAEHAGVGIGLINYHFGSKDKLLGIVVGDVMAKTISAFTKENTYGDLDPVTKLKMMMNQLYEVGMENEKLLHFLLTREIIDGNMQTPLYLLPILREIFVDKKNDIQLRIIALQILYPMQVTALNQSVFHMYSGIDLKNGEQRSNFVEILIDNLVNDNEGKGDN